jgi:hypothetical protein
MDFDPEKDIQKIMEKNMKLILDIGFITSEFELRWPRIDSWGFDNESNSFICDLWALVKLKPKFLLYLVTYQF